jgi:hypothetical protein
MRVALKEPGGIPAGYMGGNGMLTGRSSVLPSINAIFPVEMEMVGCKNELWGLTASPARLFRPQWFVRRTSTATKESAALSLIISN